MEKESIPEEHAQRPTALQEQRLQNNTKPQQSESSNDRATESNVEKSNNAKEDDCLSLYAKEFWDTEMQEVFNEIISMPRSLNESISFPPVRKPDTTP